jgi:hypothetical protein
MTIWKALLFALSVSILQNSIAAVGTITDQVAAVPSIQRSKTTLQGTKGTGVEMNDAIKTAAGKVGIKFEDNTTVQINENSRLVIDDFVYDPKSKAGKLAVNVASGTVRYASGQIAKKSPQNVAVNTPSATISVRGTDFTATVDELGRSTIILLPSCPDDIKNKSTRDIERDCKTGEIAVDSDAGQVILNRPFQATTVENRAATPAKPVILKLTEDAISNILIISPPKELKEDKTSAKVEMKGVLDVDFLAENLLVDELAKSEQELYQDKLSKNFLDQDFLANVLDIINAQMAAQLDLLNTQKSGLLPDYVATSGVVAYVDDLKVELCRDSGSDIQCVTTPKGQNSTITQIQGSVEIRNRINSGGSTIINITQR